MRIAFTLVPFLFLAVATALVLPSSWLSPAEAETLTAKHRKAAEATSTRPVRSVRPPPLEDSTCAFLCGNNNMCVAKHFCGTGCYKDTDCAPPNATEGSCSECDPVSRECRPPRDPTACDESTNFTQVPSMQIMEDYASFDGLPDVQSCLAKCCPSDLCAAVTWIQASWGTLCYLHNHTTKQAPNPNTTVYIRNSVFPPDDNTRCPRCDLMDGECSAGFGCGCPCSDDTDCDNQSPTCNQCLGRSDTGLGSCGGGVTPPADKCIPPFPGQPHKNCSDNFDLLFLLDGSGSITPPDWVLIKKFTLNIGLNFSSAPALMNYGVIQFADYASTFLHLTPGNSSFQLVMNTMWKFDTSTNTGEGLQFVQYEFNNNSRPAAYKTLVIITDGEWNTGPEPIPIADQLKLNGTHIYTVAVGEANTKNVQSLASLPLSNYYFNVTTESELPIILHNIINNMCARDTPPAPPLVSLTHPFPRPYSTWSSSSSSNVEFMGNTWTWTSSSKPSTEGSDETGETRTSTGGGEEETSAPGGPVSVSVGLVLLGGGIILINLNERRAKKQDQLTTMCETQVVSLNEDKDAPKTLEALAGRIVHVHGDLKASEPWPRDETLGVEQPNMLRMKRIVQMYQWEEKRHEETNKETKEKKVWYTYNKRWASQHLSTRDDRNPSFPEFDSIRGESGSINLLYESLKMLLSGNFVHRLTLFESVRDIKPIDQGIAAASHNLTLLSDKTGFYTTGRSKQSPQIGDVQVTYQVVRPGPYTALAKYDPSEGITPYTASLKTSLASEGEIIIPKEAHEVSQKATGEKLLTLPPWLIETVESWMLAAVPLEFAHLEPGHWKKTDAYAHNRAEDAKATDMLYYVGLFACVVGCAMTATVAAPFVGTQGSIGGGAVTGFGIATQTQRAAHEQVFGKDGRVEPGKTRPGGPSKGDVTL